MCSAVSSFSSRSRHISIGVRARGPTSPAGRALSLGAFAAALLSKAAAMPLPVVLLLLDVYPLRRCHLGWRRLLIEKAPYVALAGAAAVTALIALRQGVAVTSYENYGALARLGMVAYSTLFYPIAFLWPTRLSPMYELPHRVSLGVWPFYPALLGVVVASVILVLVRRRWPAGLAAWIYSAVMILPVSGVVHSGSQLVNDRYSYLSGIGFALVGGAILWAGLGLRERGRLSAGTAATVAGGRDPDPPGAGRDHVGTDLCLAGSGDALAMGGGHGPDLLAMPRQSRGGHQQRPDRKGAPRRSGGAPAPSHRSPSGQPDPLLQPRQRPARPEAVPGRRARVPEIQ